MGIFRRIAGVVTPAEAGFLGLVAVYMAASSITAYHAGFGDAFHPFIYSDVSLILTFEFFLIYILYRLLRAAFILIRHRPAKPLLFILQDLNKGPLHGEYYRRALPVFVGFFFFFSTFSSMKMLIPRLHSFTWDAFFMQADRFFFFGHDAWQVLQPVLGHPLITSLISLVYIFWLPVFFMVLYWQLFRLKDQRTRLRFFYTFVLSWAINGTLLAVLFSSAGPCYYQSVTDSDHYAPLMAYLHKVHETYPVYALHTQDLLWQNFQRGGAIIGGGISAFPSVHVATAFLFVLLGYKTGRKTCIGFTVFFLFILLGSIHLGWHYAADGLFAILSTGVIWLITGQFPSTYRAAAYRRR